MNMNKNFTRCMFSNECIFLEDGKIASCGLPFYIKHFNSFFGKNIPVSKSDYCDIYKVKSIKEIMRFLAKPMPLCSFCDIESSSYYKDKWGVSKRNIGEWT